MGELSRRTGFLADWQTGRLVAWWAFRGTGEGVMHWFSRMTCNFLLDNNPLPPDRVSVTLFCSHHTEWNFLRQKV